VIVSEERGTISFCFNGNIASNLDGPKLKTLLEAVFSPKTAQKKRAPSRRSAGTSLPTIGEGALATGDGVAATTTVEDGIAATRTRTGQDLVRTSPELPRLSDYKTAEERDSADADRPTPLRRGLESDPPPPLRSRSGLDDSLLLPGRLPRAAKVPGTVRTVLSSRETPIVLRTPVAASPTEAKEPRDADSDASNDSNKEST
jgi:hypothetical protein